MVSLPTILLILAGIGIGATVIATLVALRSAREARSAIFPIVKEEETLRAQRARISIFIWVAVTALFLGGWLATLGLNRSEDAPLVSDALPTQPAQPTNAQLAPEAPPATLETPLAEVKLIEIEAPPTNTPLPAPTQPSLAAPESEPEPATATPAEVVEISPTEPLPSPTPSPSSTSTATPIPPTATPTPTPTPLPPTATPTPDLATLSQIPTPAPRTPAPAGARMGPIQFAAEITPDIRPVNPNNVFPQELDAIYAVYPYSGMVNGSAFTAVWYQDGVELWRDQQEWRWGDKAQFYSFLNPPGDGLYKLELYVNDSVVATGLFEIR